MQISVPTTSNTLQNILSVAQVAEIMKRYQQQGTFSFTLYNTSGSIIYVERFDATATTTTSVPVAATTGTFVFNERDIGSISLITGNASPVNVIIG